MSITQINCSVIILAAGRSNRMGKAKFALEFSVNKTFLEEIIHQYHSFGCKQIIIVLNEKGQDYIKNHRFAFPDNTLLITNKYLERGRFYSIKLGVHSINSENTPVFIHNIDNPFVNHKVLQKLLSINNSGYASPTYQDKGGHPILISKHIAQQILLDKENNIVLSEFLKKFKRKRIEVDDKNILVNINTPEDYQKWESELK